jgi:hypothetical protein
MLKGSEFSKYDFRYWISQPNPDPNQLKNSLMREPWSSLIGSWIYLNKPTRHLKLFQDTIEEGIGSERYSVITINPSIFDYREFWTSALNGLIRVWLKLPLNVRSGTLTIGKNPNSITLSQSDKIQLIDILYVSKPITLHINGKDYIVGIWMTNTARQVWHIINQMASLIANNKTLV